MIRLALACAALCVLCVLAVMAATTGWAIPLAISVVGFAVWLVWHDDRAVDDLELYERRQGALDVRNPTKPEQRG